MADMDSKFKITAQATGFKQLNDQTKELIKNFTKLGQAGRSMDKDVGRGLARLQRALGGRGAGGGGGGGLGGGANTIRPGFGGGGADTGVRAGVLGLSLPTFSGVGAGLGAGMGGGYGGYGTGGFAGGGGGGGGGAGGGVAQHDPRRGSFGQGFLEGVLPGYRRIERGPGALRQAGGVVAGETVRAAGGLATGALQGPGGVIGALSAIPGIGGLLANNLGRGVIAAHEEAATERGMSGMFPFMGGGRAEAKLAAARSNFARAGFDYGGLSSTEATQTLTGAISAAGGTLDEIDPGRARALLAARSGYGVDAGASAAIMRGEDIGGAARGSGLAAMAGAKRIGLGDGEVARYVQEIAAAVSDFANTGIKVDAGSRSDVARVMELAGGATPQRAAAQAAGFGQGAMSIAEGGAQSSSQAATLMAAGWNPADPDSYNQALRNLENEHKRPAILARGIARVRRANQGASRDVLARSLREYYRDNNIHKTNTEAYEEAGRPYDEKKIMAQVEAATLAQGGEGVTTVSVEARGRDNTTVAGQYGAAEADMQTKTGVKYMGETLKSDYNATSLQQNAAGAGNVILKGANIFAEAVNRFVSRAMPGGAPPASSLRP